MKSVSKSWQLKCHSESSYSILEGHCLKNVPRVKPPDSISLNQFAH